MPKYLCRGTYTEKGLSGLLKEGGSKRRDAPDNLSSAAVSLIVNASGAVEMKTDVLLTPEEVDQVIRKSVKYRPPGK